MDLLSDYGGLLMVFGLVLGALVFLKTLGFLLRLVVFAAALGLLSFGLFGLSI